MNRRIIILVLLGVAMFLIATNVQASLLYFVSAALFGIVVLSYLAPFAMVRPVTIRRRVGGMAVEGTPVKVTAVVENRGRKARALLTVEDNLAPAAKPNIVWLPADSEQTVAYEAKLPRGVYDSAELSVTSAAPFGFRQKKRRGRPEAGLVVVPAYEDIATFPLLEALSSPAETLHERRSPGTGYDYMGVREYRQGDSLRVVHWKSSARRGELVVKEFGREISSPVAIVIDRSLDCGPPGESCLDAAARIAASVANYCLKAGHPLQMFTQGDPDLRSLIRPRFTETLEWLAALAEDSTESPDDLIENAASHFSPRSTAVIITPARAADWPGIADIGREKHVRLIVILVDPESFSDTKKVSAKTGFLETTVASLAEKRVTVYGFRKGESIRECLTEPLSATGA